MNRANFGARVGAIVIVCLIYVYVWVPYIKGPTVSLRAITILAPLSALVILAVFIYQAYVSVLRARDAGKSGWLVLLYLVPIANFIVLIYLLCAPSEESDPAVPAPAVTEAK